MNANGSVTVSKGDVQAAMGWNNAQFEANVASVPGLITATSSVTGYGDDANMILSPTGEWHVYGYSNVTGSITKPEDCQWSTAWGFEADVWQPPRPPSPSSRSRTPSRRSPAGP